MSFSVDQFMQVKCKFQLTSETESSESIHSNNEKVRLCTSVDLDRNSTLIVMVCSNETGNNHIVAYYIERRLQTTLISADTSFSNNKLDGNSGSFTKSQQNITFSFLAAVANQQSPSRNGYITRAKPRIIVKQIYYHSYNEDILAICLSDTGNKLALISASSTIYILPIKNILLNLHAKQLRSSQGKSMYFYDAVILDCCTLENPIAVAYWESLENENKSTVIVASEQGELSFISVEEKKEIYGTHVNEKIRHMKLIKDRFSYSLLITCDNFKQYRFALELLKQPDSSPDNGFQSQALNSNMYNNTDEYTYIEKDIMPSWERKPIPIKLHSSSLVQSGGSVAAAAIHRVLAPSSRAGNHTAGLFSRERSVPLIFYHPSNMISVIDILGIQRPQTTSNRVQAPEPRLLRFFSSKQFYYRPQKPILVCKLNSLDPDEVITHVVLTDRFIAIATDRDRCLINSRNCCNLRNSNSTIELDPLVKEITFNNEEKILLLLKSPVSNDQDNIIDSFLLVTNRSIYSIEARQSCRDMFVSLIDSHLGIKPARYKNQSISDRLIKSGINSNEYCTIIEPYTARRKNSESNLMVSNFLCHRDEVYERISYDSRAFSFLFKLELNSLYEAYGDKLLLRSQFDLANRFFQMAKFNHTKTIGKYIRLGAYKQTIDYVINILNDENEILDEKERIDLSKAAFECLLAKTIVERSKIIVYTKNLKQNQVKKLMEYHEMKETLMKNSPMKRYDPLARRWSNSSITKIDPFQLCEHSPQCQTAKLSANTIVVEADEEEDESTMTACTIDKRQKMINRLECEKALINFINNFMPSSLSSYAMTQLVDFDLIDLADIVARSDVRIYSLIRILLRAKDENRMIFRDGRFESLVNKLTGKNYKNLVGVDDSEPKFLEFITSPVVTKALVKDINLASEYFGYQQTMMQFRKYSFATLRQLDLFRKFVICQRDGQQQHQQQQEKIELGRQGDGVQQKLFTKQERQTMENIFIEFMNACLDESTEDSCRLWFNYINFYLNYVGTRNELEQDILNLLELSTSDCRLAITLFKAINKDENEPTKPFSTEAIVNTPLESMKKLYNLAGLFKNEFLMKLLEKTLDLVLCECVRDFSHVLAVASL